jgi:integrase
MKASFKQYLLFLGIQEDDKRLNSLKKPKRRASALTSLSELGKKVIPKKDLQFLYDNVDDEWKLIIGFLYDTAVRESEMLSLKWRSITFYDNPTNNMSGEALVLGKGGKPRIVYITKKTTDLLKKLRPNIQDNDLVFVFRMDDGKLFKRQEKALYDGIVKLTKEIIGRKYTPHCLRHSRATHLVSSGGEVGGISNMLGHSSYAVTQIYIKSSTVMAKNMISKLPEGLE